MSKHNDGGPLPDGEDKLVGEQGPEAFVVPDPEFVAVPPAQQLDSDPPPGGDNDALDEATGDDTADLDSYRDLDGPVWDGKSG